MADKSRQWLVTALYLFGVFCSAAQAFPDFTFLHLSDVHIPHAAAQSRATIAALPTTGEVRLEPYGVSVPAPSFAVVTGDLNEFGGGDGCWEQYLELWRALPFPVYHQLGNHDNTWDCGRPRLRRLHGSAFYAFERGRVKFIGWDTATPQDPRPAIATEGLLWLEAELGRTPSEQPIIFFCHHPLDSAEFASEYDRCRLLDLLHTRNVALLLAGHGHGVRAWRIGGFDAVMGGSTYGERAGYGIVSIKGDVLRVCYQHVGRVRETVGLLEKPLPAHAPLLHVKRVSPPDGYVFAADEPVKWRMEVEGEALSGTWAVQGGPKGALVREDGAWSATVEESLPPGAHWVRLEVQGAAGESAGRSVAFWVDNGPVRIAWKRQLSGSCQSTPVVSGGRLYVGANDGCLYAFEAARGRLLWRLGTQGEVRSQPAIDESTDLVFFGSSDGRVYAATTDGVLRWSYDVGSPVYASPLLVGNALVCGSNAGAVVALRKATGELLWRAEEPEYAVEAAPAVGAGAVYAGAWDRYLYALELTSGALRWRQTTRGSEQESGAARYYSPADCAPAFVGANVAVADRAYWLTILEAGTGRRLSTEEKCVAVAPAGDGQHVYARFSDDRVSKLRADGSVVWTARVPTGFVPTPPTEAHGKVLAVSGLGTLSVLRADSGEVLARYKAFPDLFAFAAPAFDGERAYLADMGGHLLALKVGAL